MRYALHGQTNTRLGPLFFWLLQRSSIVSCIREDKVAAPWQPAFRHVYVSSYGSLRRFRTLLAGSWLCVALACLAWVLRHSGTLRRRQPWAWSVEQLPRVAARAQRLKCRCNIAALRVVCSAVRQSSKPGAGQGARTKASIPLWFVTRWELETCATLR